MGDEAFTNTSIYNWKTPDGGLVIPKLSIQPRQRFVAPDKRYDPTSALQIDTISNDFTPSRGVIQGTAIPLVLPAKDQLRGPFFFAHSPMVSMGYGETRFELPMLPEGGSKEASLAGPPLYLLGVNPGIPIPQGVSWSDRTRYLFQAVAGFENRMPAAAHDRFAQIQRAPNDVRVRDMVDIAISLQGADSAYARIVAPLEPTFETGTDDAILRGCMSAASSLEAEDVKDDDCAFAFAALPTPRLQQAQFEQLRANGIKECVNGFFETAEGERFPAVAEDGVAVDIAERPKQAAPLVPRVKTFGDVFPERYKNTSEFSTSVGDAHPFNPPTLVEEKRPEEQIGAPLGGQALTVREDGAGVDGFTEPEGNVAARVSGEQVLETSIPLNTTEQSAFNEEKMREPAVPAGGQQPASAPPQSGLAPLRLAPHERTEPISGAPENAAPSVVGKPPVIQSPDPLPAEGDILPQRIGFPDEVKERVPDDVGSREVSPIDDAPNAPWIQGSPDVAPVKKFFPEAPVVSPTGIEVEPPAELGDVKEFFDTIEEKEVIDDDFSGAFEIIEEKKAAHVEGINEKFADYEAALDVGREIEAIVEEPLVAITVNPELGPDQGYMFNAVTEPDNGLPLFGAGLGSSGVSGGPRYTGAVPPPKPKTRISVRPRIPIEHVVATDSTPTIFTQIPNTPVRTSVVIDDKRTGEAVFEGFEDVVYVSGVDSSTGRRKSSRAPLVDRAKKTRMANTPSEYGGFLASKKSAISARRQAAIRNPKPKSDVPPDQPEGRAIKVRSNMIVSHDATPSFISRNLKDTAVHTPSVRKSSTNSDTPNIDGLPTNVRLSAENAKRLSESMLGSSEIVHANLKLSRAQTNTQVNDVVAAANSSELFMDVDNECRTQAWESQRNATPADRVVLQPSVVNQRATEHSAWVNRVDMQQSQVHYAQVINQPINPTAQVQYQPAQYMDDPSRLTHMQERVNRIESLKTGTPAYYVNHPTVVQAFEHMAANAESEHFGMLERNYIQLVQGIEEQLVIEQRTGVAHDMQYGTGIYHQPAAPQVHQEPIQQQPAQPIQQQRAPQPIQQQRAPQQIQQQQASQPPQPRVQRVAPQPTPVQQPVESKQADPTPQQRVSDEGREFLSEGAPAAAQPSRVSDQITRAKKMEDMGQQMVQEHLDNRHDDSAHLLPIAQSNPLSSSSHNAVRVAIAEAAPIGGFEISEYESAVQEQTDLFQRVNSEFEANLGGVSRDKRLYELTSDGQPQNNAEQIIVVFPYFL